MRQQLTDWEKTLEATHLSNKGLISKIPKELKGLIARKQSYLKMAKIFFNGKDA